jgi:predicted dehydrogenase
MVKVKIIGAGSIGTHHAHACRRLGWDVLVTDVSAPALDRMRTQLFPQRYGHWDNGVRLAAPDAVPVGGFDLIIVGTPPESHVALALAAIGEQPNAILIEKPLAVPGAADLGDLVRKASATQTRIFVGYDHVVGKAAQMVAAELAARTVGRILTLDVEFREHWAGIFQAHPWLSGPEDSYLGFWQRGGGAAGEHSHAINLWQYFARLAAGGSVSQVQASLDYVTDGRALYDRLCFLNLRTENGLLGRVVQDVVTLPARKWARIQGDAGAIEWHVGYSSGADAVIVKRPGSDDDVRVMSKTRPDDFIQELLHIHRCWSEGTASPLDLAHGVETMRVIEAAHASGGMGVAVPPAAGHSTVGAAAR